MAQQWFRAQSANAGVDRLAKLVAEAIRLPREICLETPKVCDRAHRFGKWIDQATVAAGWTCIRDSQPGVRRKRVPRIECARGDSDFPLAHRVSRACGRSSLDLDMGPLVQPACRQRRRRRPVSGGQSIIPRPCRHRPWHQRPTRKLLGEANVVGLRFCLGFGQTRENTFE